MMTTPFSTDTGCLLRRKSLGKNKILRERIKRDSMEDIHSSLFYCRNSERFVMKVMATTLQCLSVLS